MSTDKGRAAAAETPIEVALNVDLGQAQVEQIRAAFPHARLATKADLEQHPERFLRAEVLFTRQMDPRKLAELPKLRWIQSYGAGVEWLLVESVVTRDELIVTNARGIHAEPIAEHVFGLMLALARRLDGSILQQQQRDWNPSALTGSLRTLEGSTLGILGLGAIGRRLASVGKAFGMRVLGTRHSGKPTPHVDETYGPDGLLRVMAASEWIVNALPFTPQTRKLIGRAAFAEVRPDAVFVNIGRGASVDTEALLHVLQSKKLGGALLDVTDPEPLPREHPLWTLPNVIITPHYAGAHPGYNERVTAIFIENLRRYLSQQPLTNLVDKRAGY
ncbi:MAG: D-isomer specific 2-hydroxyacid dehydrogenase NAD-binding protein [Myxococcaceae bacterium]|nr:D-isomer specific 2-hydroxyacid dehydrogenase NAD-binding protein [Myxococcaceae bacterium]